jgi:uncharacterized protein (DUF305 family)
MVTSRATDRLSALAGGSRHAAASPSGRKLRLPYLGALAHDASRAFIVGSDSSRAPMMDMTGMMAMHATSGSVEKHPMPDSKAMHPPASAANQSAMMPMPMVGDMARKFPEHMIVQHESGIDLSVLAQESQADPRVRELAKKIRE